MAHPPLSAFHRPALRVGLPVLLLAALVLVAFRRVFEIPLAFDDWTTIQHVNRFTSWHQAWGLDPYLFFRPVKNLFFYLVEQTGGGEARYHGFNLAAYYLAACGVFALTLRLSGNALASFAAAAIWAISPTGGTVALWASCFNISVAAASMCFCAIAYDCMRDSDSRHPAISGTLAALFLCLGLLSYETAIATAPLLVLIDLFRGRKIFSKQSMLLYAGIAAIVIVWLVCRQMNQAAAVRGMNPSYAPGMPGWQLTASAPYFLWTHLMMWLAPSGRLETFGSYLWDRSVPAAILPFCWVFLAGMVFLGIGFWKKAPLLAFGAAWFVIAAFPSGNFIPLRNTPYADYYVPIPSIGICIMLAAGLRAALRRLREPGLERPAMAGLMATVVGIIGWRVAQLPVLADWLEAWKAPVQVMARTAAARPHQFFAQATLAYNFAFNFPDKGEDLLTLIESNATEAARDMPDLGITYSALGEVARSRGDYKGAIALFEKSLASRHISVQSEIRTRHRLVETLVDHTSEFDRAYENLLQLLRRPTHEDHPKFVLLAGKLQHKAGKPQEEIKDLEKGLKLHPNNPEIQAALKEARARTAGTS